MRKSISTRVLKAACWLVLCFFMIEVIDYGLDARLRTRWVDECQWEDERPSLDALPYVARWCILKRDVVMLRLYDKDGKTLLAERMFDYPTFPRIYWKSDELGYQTFGGGGAITLPPSTLDRWRTHLP